VDIPDNLPREIPWSQIVQFDKLDERVSAVGCLFVNIIGVNDGYVEWCPNDDPPTQDEYLAWVWVVRPDLGSLMKEEVGKDFTALIAAYESDDLGSWFQYMAT